MPYANVSSIDPIASPAYFARNHGFMVYDTLYGWNDRLEPEPQMAAGHTVEDDGRLLFEPIVAMEGHGNTLRQL